MGGECSRHSISRGRLTGAWLQRSSIKFLPRLKYRRPPCASRDLVSPPCRKSSFFCKISFSRNWQLLVIMESSVVYTLGFPVLISFVPSLSALLHLFPSYSLTKPHPLGLVCCFSSGSCPWWPLSVHASLPMLRQGLPMLTSQRSHSQNWCANMEWLIIKGRQIFWVSWPIDNFLYCSERRFLFYGKYARALYLVNRSTEVWSRLPWMYSLVFPLFAV